MASESKINRRSFLKAAAVAPLLATARVSQTLKGAVATNRNILLFIADDCGVDQIQTYVDYYAKNGFTIKTSVPTADLDGVPNDPFPVTRTLQNLATAGVTFINAWAPPVCSPSRACLYTGNHCFRHNVYQAGGVLPSTIDGAPTATIASVLKGCNYATALFGKWHLGDVQLDGCPDLTQVTPTKAIKNGAVFFGWDQYAGTFGGSVENNDGSGGYLNWKYTNEGYGVTPTCPKESEKKYAPLKNEEDTLAWITSHQTQQPWFAVVAFNAPHDPWVALADDYYPPRTLNGSDVTKWRCIYHSMIESIDIYIGKLLDNMKAMNPTMLDNTTIIFVGDNGTPDEINIHYANKHNKGTIYQGGIHVPLIIADGCAYRMGVTSQSSSAGRVASPGRTCSDPVNTLDLFATCAEIGGNTTIPHAHDSVSLIPYLSGVLPSTPRRVLAFAESKSATAAYPDVAVMDRDLYKLIVRRYNRAAKSGSKQELYNLKTDPWETDDLLDPLVAGSPETKIASNLAGMIDDVYDGIR